MKPAPQVFEGWTRYETPLSWSYNMAIDGLKHLIIGGVFNMQWNEKAAKKVRVTVEWL